MTRYTRTSSFARRESVLLAATRVCVIAWLVLGLAAPRATAQTSSQDGEARRIGDFQPGDRIVVITRGDSTSVDTLIVQSDRTVILQKLPPISLIGVIRSDLQNYLRQQLRQYVKRDLVSATLLVPVGVLGEVAHPGYYRVPLQITLGDVLMVAGGPSPQADLTRVRVRRGDSTIIDAHSVRDAMARRLSLGELGIEAGDEVILRAAPQRNWVLITQLAGVVTGLALTLHSFKVF